MVPFHPLRREARASMVRAAAPVAVFIAIAILLLAGGGTDPLADAEANKGDPGDGQVAAVAAPEPAAPVDQSSDSSASSEASNTAETIQDADQSQSSSTTCVVGCGGSGQAQGLEQSSSTEQDADSSVDADQGEPTDPEEPGSGLPEGGDFEPPEREDLEPPERDDLRVPGLSGLGGVDDPDDSDDPGAGRAGAERRMPSLAPLGLSGGSKGDTVDGEAGEPGESGEPAPSGRTEAPATLPSEEPAPLSAGEPPVQGGTQPGGGGAQGGILLDPTGAGGDGDRTARFRSSVGAGAGTGGTADGDTADSTASGGVEPAPAAGAEAFAQVGSGEDGGDGSAPSDDPGEGGAIQPEEPGPIVVPDVVQNIVEVVPDSLKVALAALAALSTLLGLGYLLASLRARRLARQRRELLQEVGLLQSALLPPVPDRLGALRTSVAYRPADGPGAGGDFYDVLPLPAGRVGFILGDVSGHGRGALARTAFMRYTLRAYLEAGLEPRVALQVAGRVIDDNLGGDFATVLLAVHDPETGSLTYATAGHPAPIVVGPQPHDPVTAGSAPPIGVGVRTGLRQTTVPLVPGSVACLFTDGLMEARTEEGILGRERLAELLDELGEQASARGLIDRVALEARALSDDIAAVVVSPTAGVTAGLFRTEQLELSARELEGPTAARFLAACGLPEDEAADAERDARMLADRFGGVVLHVVFGNRLRVEVLPRNVESIEAASRRVSAGSPQ